MLDFIQSILSRVIASIIGALAAWVATKYGVNISQDTQTQIVQHTVTLGLAVFGIVYAITHRTIDKKVNPGDHASPSKMEEQSVPISDPGNKFVGPPQDPGKH